MHRSDGPAAGGRWRLAVASVAVLLAAADTYVVVLALPDVMAGVGLTTADLGRAAPIVSAFLLGYTTLLPLVGRVSDRHGRIGTLAGCLLTFAIGSACTAGAHGLGLVVAGRFLQGLGGGGLVPVTFALVADLWPAGRRGLPLGTVGAVQEVGALVGPLYGAAVVAWAGWRAIFWINAAAGAVLAAVLLAGMRGRRRTDPLGWALAAVAVAGGVLVLAAPAGLTASVRYGGAFVPLAPGQPVTQPLAILALAAAALFVVRSATARHPVLPLRRLPALARDADVPGAVLLAGALGCVVVTFATADPTRQVTASAGPVLLGAAALLGAAFVRRQLRTPEPLVDLRGLTDRAAVGALATSLALGCALMAVLVDVPLFARATAYPDSQLGAALVLVRFLVGVPVGALAGGAVCERLTYRATAAAGLAAAAATLAAMARWGQHALATAGPGASDVVLFACGVGFGLAAAPVTAAALRAVGEHQHGAVSALVVVARTVGMLVGLSVLTAVGLHRFYAAQDRIASPVTLCPTHPARCPAYSDAVQGAALDQLHAVFAGAAVAAALAALLALVLLRAAPAPATATPRVVEGA